MSATVPDEQFAERKLFRGNDYISTAGNDVAAGDSMTLFIQADRPNEAGFEFEGLEENSSIRRALSAISTARESMRDDHVTLDLVPSDPLSNQQQSSLSFDDVPFVLSSSEDILELNGSSSLISGDFAFIGVTASSQTPFTDTAYSESVLTLQTRPVQSSVVPGEGVVDQIDLDFYNGRFSSQVGRIVEPTLHGDFVNGTSTELNVVLGDVLTAIGSFDGTSLFTFDNQANAFSGYTNGRLSIEFSPDTFNVDGSSILVDGQTGKDEFLSGSKTNQKLDGDISGFTERLFSNNALLGQMRDDLFSSFLLGTRSFKIGFQCPTVLVSNITSMCEETPVTSSSTGSS